MKRLAVLLACAACARSLKTPRSIDAIANPPLAGEHQVLAEADVAFGERADPERARAAEDLYLRAARADPTDPRGYAGAIRTKAFRIGREKDPAIRKRLATEAVEVGQLCERDTREAPACDYWLAAALGLQARERTSTAHDALSHMEELLRRAAAREPALDHGGPHRLLALVLLRAPGWPVGPGDAEAALPEAQAAMAVDKDYPPNQLALGEALRKNGRDAEARAAYSEALRLAASSAFSHDPDAAGWAEEARAALR